MLKIVTLILAILLFSVPAHAYKCSDVSATASAVDKAETKQNVADALKRFGVDASDADNVAHASPDVLVAKGTALAWLARLQEKCTAQAR